MSAYPLISDIINGWPRRNASRGHMCVGIRFLTLNKLHGANRDAFEFDVSFECFFFLKSQFPWWFLLAIPQQSAQMKNF